MYTIKRSLLLLGAVIPAILGAPVTEPHVRRSGEKISGKYIVTFKEGTDSAKIAAHTAWATSVHQRNVASIQGGSHAGIERNYQIDTFAAYAGSFDDATIEEIRNHEDVRHPPGGKEPEGGLSAKDCANIVFFFFFF